MNNAVRLRNISYRQELFSSVNGNLYCIIMTASVSVVMTSWWDRNAYFCAHLICLLAVLFAVRVMHLKLSVMTCHNLKRKQAGSMYLPDNLISQHAYYWTQLYKLLALTAN